jgi:DNA repair protein RecN (Recombination protein N)
MLTELRVRDLAVISDVTLRLNAGLNVLTGETGAGKSMLVDALALLLGERASGDLVRPGAQKAIVEGVFEFTSPDLARLPSALAALGIEVEDGLLVLKREVFPEGRSRAWINGSPATAGVLSTLGERLVDLHGQHETQSLLRGDAQRDILDAFAGALVERGAARDAHARWQALQERENELRERQEEVRRKADYLRHVVSEIERAAPKVGEDDALEVDARRLAHAADLARLAGELERALDTAGLSRAAKALAGIERLDPTTEQWRALLDGAFANVEELAAAVRDYAGRIEGDPARLAQAEERRDQLYRLKQKHGPAIADVLATRDRSAKELELLDTADFDLRALSAEREAAAQDFARACAALTEKRKAGAVQLSAAVNRLLPELGMPGGVFTVRMQPRTSHLAQGAEDVTFEIKLNAGLESRPLARVASGGELSRLMLALKVVLAEHDALPVLVFDEVDQGIGGEVGGRVGEALRRVAQHHQTLVITHLPQIAAHAEHHVVITKHAHGTGGVATSDVEAVSGDGRARELARMLGDADMATALRHAQELLKGASGSAGARSETPSRPGSRPRRAR